MIYCSQTKTWNSCMKKCFCHLTIPQKGWSRRNTDVIIACGCFGTPMLTPFDLGTIWKTKRGVENHRNRSETGKDEAWNNTHWDFSDFDKKTSYFSNFHYDFHWPLWYAAASDPATSGISSNQHGGRSPWARPLVLETWKPGRVFQCPGENQWLEHIGTPKSPRTQVAAFQHHFIEIHLFLNPEVLDWCP